MGFIKNTLQRGINAAWYATNGRKPSAYPRSRMHNLLKTSQKRDYNAADMNTLTANWNTMPTTADYVTRSALKILRARSREQYSNNDYAKKFVRMSKDNVIGNQGIVIQAKAKKPNGQLDKSDNDAIEAAWRKWSKPRNCDFLGQSSFRELQKQMVQSLLVDGEYCIIIHRTNKYPFIQLEMVDAELLDVDHHDELKNGGCIKFGIEYDKNGKPVAYWLRELNETGDFYTLGNQRKRIDSRSFIHGFIKERIGQKRGMPHMATSLLRMNMQSGFENASLVNARVGASKMGFYKSADGVGYAGDDVASDGSLISDAEPGSFEQLPQGVEFVPYDPTYPTNEFAAFNKAVLRGISSGLGVSYNTLANDLEGVNYSSIRQGVLDEREVWKGLQEWMIETANDPIYQEWLMSFLAFGAITVGNGVLPASKFDKFTDVEWQPRRWSWVDPAKDVKANIDSIDNSLKSRSDVIRESGRNPEDVWLEIQRENDILNSLGITGSAGKEETPQDEGPDSDDMRSRYERAVRDRKIAAQPEYDELMRLLDEVE